MTAASPSLARAMLARAASFHQTSSSGLRRGALMLLVGMFHLVQPAARLVGRIQHGLGPWSWKGFIPVIPVPKTWAFWSEHWQATETRLSKIEQILQSSGAAVIRGGDFDSWDLTVHGGLFGSIRSLAMVEEHGGGKQLFRLRAYPTVPPPALMFLQQLPHERLRRDTPLEKPR